MAVFAALLDFSISDYVYHLVFTIQNLTTLEYISLLTVNNYLMLTSDHNLDQTTAHNRLIKCLKICVGLYLCSHQFVPLHFPSTT